MNDLPDPSAAALEATAETERAVAALMLAADRPAPRFWEPGVGEEIRVPVAGAEVRVFHFAGPNGGQARGAQRPIVLVPGFGVIPEGFQDFFAAVHGLTELYYVETREKSSSRIAAGRADMSVSRSARDLAQVFSFLGLDNRDFVLFAPCWGAAICLQGLIEGSLRAPTFLMGDPMHTLWFPKWLLRWVSPLLPVGLVRLLRPMFARAMIGDMEEPVQRARAHAFVYGADIWKWQKSAEAAKDFELYGRLGSIEREVFVLNGTKDKIHDQRDYPRLAAEMPRGRFIHMPTGEANRERLFGAASLEFARISAADGMPPSLAAYEKPVR
jgi:pimeloyl-ACP methyl ester carboxylesterase